MAIGATLFPVLRDYEALPGNCRLAGCLARRLAGRLVRRVSARANASDKHKNPISGEQEEARCRAAVVQQLTI